MHSKWKIPDPWRTGWKAKASTSFVLNLKVFKNHLYYLWHVRVLFIKPCLHKQLPEHNKSYRKSFPWMRAFDHLECTYDGAFEQLFGLGRGEFEQKFSKNSNARGLPGGGCWSFDLTGTLLKGRSEVTSVWRDFASHEERSDLPDLYGLERASLRGAIVILIHRTATQLVACEHRQIFGFCFVQHKTNSL